LANIDSALSDISYFNSLDSLLNSDLKLDLISICTPNGLHAEQSIAALKAGCHVICEKPLALRYQDCLLMIEQATYSNRELFCVLQNRYSPQIQWLKKLITEVSLGRIFQVHIHCFWNRDDRYYFVNENDKMKHHPWRGTLSLDGGPLFTQFSHFVDILNWVFGKAILNSANFSNHTHQHSSQFEDSGLLRFTLEKGGEGTFNYSTAVWDRNQESSITVIGEKGSIRIGGQYMNRIDYCHVQDHSAPESMDNPAVNDYGTYSGSANNHYAVYDNVASVLNKKKQPDFDIIEAADGVRFIETAYLSRI
jgi:predicted dehydrogenase